MGEVRVRKVQNNAMQMRPRQGERLNIRIPQYLWWCQEDIYLQFDCLIIIVFVIITRKAPTHQGGRP